MKILNSAVCLFLSVAMLRATCPTPTSNAHWSYGTGVAYSFPANNTVPCWRPDSITSLGINSDIDAAFNQWSNADASQNGSNVGFYYSASSPFWVFAQTVVDPIGCGTSVAAQTWVAVYSGTPIVAFSQTFFYFGVV